ncbi:MAG: Stp1/IreP family PP2C-type Ser/Thr phosphatase [Defluviitaleaceae bacterium]|nr:Stp1/IreP family PP2C-type Ser/Thr phosphatase [Defluviitaleaceae bacterium]
MQMVGVGKSHIGQVRSQNQDAIFICNDGLPPLANLYIVADGLGGHSSGEVASRRATEAFCSFFNSFVCDDENLSKPPQNVLAEALAYANLQVYDDSIKNKEHEGMGTTFSAATIVQGNLHFVHVGDSRIYLVGNDGGIIQMTTDHLSITAELLEQGLITQEEARKYPATVLSRAIGTDTAVEIDIGQSSLDGMKYVVLCSDGLYNMLDDNQISKIINEENNLEEMAKKLTKAANAAGGLDNISVIVIGWGDVL